MFIFDLISHTQKKKKKTERERLIFLVPSVSDKVYEDKALLLASPHSIAQLLLGWA
jgi:hypothetical protein